MNKVKNISEIVNRAKKNDVLAIRFLYEAYAKEMLTLSFRITQNLEEAEDIIQEAFLTSFQRLKQLKKPEHYYGWLKKIVINNSLKANQKKRTTASVDSLASLSEEKDQAWYKDISFEQIKRAINQLPDGCREVFTLYLLEDYKHREIAEILNISVSTSKSQYQYALKLLKRELKKHLV